MTQSPVDLVTVVVATYTRVGQERAYLVRLMVFPFLLAWFNVVLVNVMDIEVSVLRRGLLMLPSVFAEGWLVAQFLRTVMTGERWPQRIPRPLPHPLPPGVMMRVRGLLGAIVMYVLTQVLTNAVVGGFLTAYPDFVGHGQTPTEPPPTAMGIAFGMLVVSVFQFRLFFLHVPMVVNGRLRDYLKATRPWSVNIQMVAGWLGVQVPLLAVTLVVLQPLVQGGTGADIFAFGAFLLVSGLSVVVQLVLAILGSLVVAAILFPHLVVSPESRR